MQLHLSNIAKRSTRIRYLSAIALILSIFSIPLYLPDALHVISTNHPYKEMLYHEYIHIFLSFMLVLISWFSFHNHHLQKRAAIVIESLPHAVILFSETGRMITANKKACEFLNRLNDHHHINYKQFVELLYLHNLHSKDSVANIQNPFISSLTNQNATFQDVFKDKDGTMSLVQCQMIDHSMKVTLITDVTKIYDMNKESYTLLTALNLSPTGLALATRNGNCYNVFYYNNAYQILVDLDHQTTDLSVHIIKMASLAEWMNIDQALSQSLPYHFEGKIGNDNESTRWLSCQLFPIQQNSQEIILIYVNDCTEQKIKDAQSQQSIRLETIGHLSGGIAHDFNNILSIIQGYQTLSAKENLSRATFLEYNHYMAEAIGRGSLLTKQLLSFGNSNIQYTGSTELICQMRELESLLKTLVHGSAELRFLIPHDLQVRLNCSIDVFTQIIMNLVINARDALIHGGQITVSAHKLSERDILLLPKTLQNSGHQYICIRVQDNGCGISPENLPHIFDPFFTTKDTNKGTGLGLSLIYRHIKNINGHIDVTSVLSEGTTMSVYIPISQQSVDIEKLQYIHDLDHHDLNEKTILLVDDETHIRSITRHFLEDWGCHVIEASDGNEALSLQEDHDHIDLLLTDIMMPDINGIHLSHLMKAVRPEIKTIFMTGYIKTSSQNDIQIPEHSVVIYKPFQDHQLKETLLSHLYRH